MFRFTLNAGNMLTNLAGILPRMAEAIRMKLDQLDARLQRKIQTEKLRGGNPLHQRSGKLINSIRMIPATIEGHQVEGRVEGAGGVAWYGKIHEDGTFMAYEIVPLNKKALAFMLNGKMVFARRVVHPAFPPRPFMRPAAEEMHDEFITELQRTADETIRRPS
jgi:hypothetical protein